MTTSTVIAHVITTAKTQWQTRHQRGHLTISYGPGIWTRENAANITYSNPARKTVVFAMAALAAIAGIIIWRSQPQANALSVLLIIASCYGASW